MTQETFRMNNNILRIGITMRVTEADTYHEIRDSITQDWSKYLFSVFPVAIWLFIPNIGEKVVDYIRKFNLNAFILSGGEDLGRAPERDKTEFEIFKYAINHGFPLLGICRGLQAIYAWKGGKVSIESGDFRKTHVAQKHEVAFGNSIRKVNSYHGNKIDEQSLPNDLKVLARCIDDNSIEAISGNKILALMWHPEREENFQEWETELIRDFFYKNI